MSRLQRRLLAGVLVLSVVVAVAIAVAANRDPSAAGPGALLAGAGSDATDETAETRSTGSTLELEPVRGGTALPPTTAAPTSAPPSTEPTTTTTTAPTPPLGPTGTAFGPAPDSSPRAAVGGDCRSLSSPGWATADCGTASGPSGPTTWLVETKGKGWRALLLEPAGVGQWRPYLAAGDDLGSRWTEVKARMAEGPSGSADQIVGFGYRAKGSALSVDLVRHGQVAVHVELAKGAARVSRGQLDTWAAQPDGTYLHQTIRLTADGWRVVASESVGAALVPPSHL